MIALLYDIHGNLGALDAVLADARAAGAERYVLGGDYTLFGPEPEQTLARLRSLHPATWIRGNGERWTAAPDQAPENPVVGGAIAACREALGAAAVAELAALPERAELAGASFCHGSPVSDVRSFAPEPDAGDGELLGDVANGLLVFGHTHLPFARRSRDGAVELANPGSVGMPFDGDPRASYALLDPVGEAVGHRRVAYDHRASAAALHERFDGDWVDVVARRIELARADV